MFLFGDWAASRPAREIVPTRGERQREREKLCFKNLLECLIYFKCFEINAENFRGYYKLWWFVLNSIVCIYIYIRVCVCIYILVATVDRINKEFIKLYVYIFRFKYIYI